MAISFLLEFKLNKISPQKLSEIPIFTIRKRHCAGYMKVPPWPKQIQIQVAQDKPLTLSLPQVTKTEFLLTKSIQFQASR